MFFEFVKTAFGDGMAESLQRMLSPDSDAHEKNMDPGQFRSWLPYLGYDSTYDIFTLHGGMGFVLEAMPQSGADQTMADMLRGLYTAPWPAGASLQITLFATPHVKPLLIDYATLRKPDDDQHEANAERGRNARNRNLFRTLARRRADHYLKAARRPMMKGSNYLLRNYRLVISGYVPSAARDSSAKEAVARLRDNISSILFNAALPARRWEPADLINWVGDYCNPHRLFEDIAPSTYDPYRPLRDQMVDIDTRQIERRDGITFSKPNRPPIVSRSYVVKSYPPRFSLWRMAALVGNSLQSTLQYPCPFMLTMGVEFMNPSDVRMNTTANQARAQQNAASKAAPYMPDVVPKKEDWDEALREVTTTGNLVRLYHTLGLFARPDDIHRAETVAEGLWREQGFVINNISFLHRAALLSSLPMTFTRSLQHDLYALGISSTKSIPNAVHMSPVQIGEWRGSRTPVLLFGCPRGQVAGLDLYDNKEGNPNAAIIGTPGSGKSVFLNEIAWSYLGTGAQVWMLDLGRSFERLCTKADGEMIDLKAGCGININPFSSVIPEDFADDLAMLSAIVEKMAAPFASLDAFQQAAITSAITTAWNVHGNSMTVTHLRDIFRAGKLDDDHPHDQRLTDLAVMLEPYSTGGAYAEFFDGPSTVDFSNNLIVIEVESLKRSPALHRVVLMALMFRITSQMYFTRNSRKLFMIDELKQQLGDDDDPVLARIIEEAARRARKYGGSLITATHQVEDYHDSPALLTAFTLSDAVFILRQRKESIELLSRSGKLAMDDAKKRVLQNLRLEPGAYAEVYAFTQMGEGVLRLILDPYTLLLFSNRHDDNGPLDAYMAEGLSMDEAMTRLLRERGQLHDEEQV